MFGLMSYKGEIFTSLSDVLTPENLGMHIGSGHTVSRVSTPWRGSDYYSELQQGLSWIRDICKEIKGELRHEAYLELIKDNIETIDKRATGAGFAKELSLAMYETHELSRIRRNFDNATTEGLEARLRKYSVGPLLYPDEVLGDESGSARDFGLELAVGGELRMIGLTVSYKQEKKFPEPMVYTPNGQYAVQCKRISSSSKRAIQRNLEKAAKQLEGNLADYRDVKGGIIFIDITKQINPDGIRRIRDDLNDEESPFRLKMLEIRERESATFFSDDHPEVEAIVFRATYPRAATDNSAFDEWICRTAPWMRPGGSPFCDLLVKGHMRLRQKRAEDFQASRSQTN